MNKRRRVYEGKAKVLYEGPEPGTLIQHFKDDATAFNNKGELIKKFGGGENHFGNFVKAVRSRKAGDLNADILEGHQSTALCHAGNISYRLGRPASPHEIRQQLESAMTH